MNYFKALIITIWLSVSLLVGWNIANAQDSLLVQGTLVIQFEDGTELRIRQETPFTGFTECMEAAQVYGPKFVAQLAAKDWVVECVYIEFEPNV